VAGGCSGAQCWRQRQKTGKDTGRDNSNIKK
jgi:hypothetical protein